MKILNLPKQLQNKDFGFVKLRPKSKRPFEAEWQKKPYTYEEIEKWIKTGNNYGVLGACGGLIIIDADTPKLENVVTSSLPETFTVKTPKKGKHFYYYCSELQQKIVIQNNNGRYGEIISTGSQVVGAGSIHPDTGTKYIVEKDIDIATVSFLEIEQAINHLMPNKEDKKAINNDAYDELVKEYGSPYYTDKNDNVTSLNETFWAGLHASEHIEIYDPTDKTFYRYYALTGLYKEVSEDVIKKEISKRILKVSREENLPELERKRKNHTLNSIISHLKGIEEKRGVFESKQKIIHLQNGVIVFDDNYNADFKEFSPSFYSRNMSPIDYIPDAQSPRFINEFLIPALPPDDIELLQRYIGLCLLGKNLIQKFLILGGEGGKGKSTLSNLIQKLIGRINVSELRTKHLSERFELYRYRKKTLIVGVDVPGKFLSEKGAYVIKGLVGGDPFDAEQKNGTDSFIIQGDYCIVITSNSRLKIKLDGDISAWKRRLLIINYNAPKPKKKIPHFEDVLLKEEASGILNWALDGLIKLFAEIKEYGDICLTDKQENIIESLLAESDSLRAFLNECVVSDNNSDLTVNEIIEAYASYCPDKNWEAKPITVIQKELKELMLELFQVAKSNSIKRDGKGQHGFRKVALRGDF